LSGNSHKFLEVCYILFACADIRVVCIELIGKLSLLTELSSSEIKGSEKHPDVDETTGESTSQSVESLNHVNRHG